MRNFDVLFQTVYLDAVPIVDVDIFLLCDCEKLVVVKPPDI